MTEEKDVCRLRAFDGVGGQAIYENAGRWFRIAFDNEWESIELASRNEALRCVTVAPYESRDQVFQSVASMIAEVRNQWDQSFVIEDVPLSEIIHLFPFVLRRAWETARQLELIKEQSLEDRARLTRIQMRSQRARRPRSSTLFSMPRRWQVKSPSLEKSENEIWNIASTFVEQTAQRWVWPPIQTVDAEDVVAVATYRMVRQLTDNKRLLESFKQNSQAGSTYASRILQSAKIDEMRKAARRPAAISLADLTHEPIEHRNAQPVVAAERSELRTILSQAIDKLSPTTANVFRAMFGPQLSSPHDPYPLTVAETAQQLRLSVSVVRYLRKTGLRQLQKSLSASGFDFEDF